jgi:RNA polymerase sigma factor (sigma-70 family)
MTFFLRRVGQYPEAEDLTQQVFVRLLAGSPINRVEDAEAYVFTIATNLLRDRARKAMRGSHDAPLDQALIDELMQGIVEERTPERVLLARESLAEVLKALEGLGERTRDIFILSRLENMKHRSIADLYGIGVSTVEKHVIKAALFLAVRYSGK